MGFLGKIMWMAIGAFIFFIASSVFAHAALQPDPLAPILGMGGTSIGVFDRAIADSTDSKADIAGHYPASPERWRLFNGTDQEKNRIFLQYYQDDRYAHGRLYTPSAPKDVHSLRPREGEPLYFETAERFRYVVGYGLQNSMAFSVNRSINDNTYVVICSCDGDNGYGVNITSDYNATMFIERNDTVVAERDVRLPAPATQFTRVAQLFSWYNVGDYSLTSSYTENNRQINARLGSLSVDDQRGPETGNFPVRYEIHRPSGTEPVTLEAGSVASIVQGTTKTLTRRKADDWLDNISTTNAWVPVRAFRVKPREQIVNVQISDMQALSYSADTTLDMDVLVFSNQSVTFSGADSWSTPAVWNAQNNAVETRYDVNTIVDQNGTVVSSTQDPGGFQAGHAVLTPTGKQFDKGASSEGLLAKRNVPAKDIAVVVANVGTTGDALYSLTFEQDW
jgi:hypothetical protein